VKGIASIVILVVSLFTALTGCEGRRAKLVSEGPIGGADVLDRAIEAAISRAEPDGDVLVIGWKVSSPPTEDVFSLVRRWRPYGLVSIGIDVDLWDGKDRKKAIADVRSLENRVKVPMRSLIYDGSPEDLYRHFEGVSGVPFIALLDTRGHTIFSDRGFGSLRSLNEVIKKRLGEPPVASLVTARRIDRGFRPIRSLTGSRPHP
jgi:hypothetical protein